MKKILPLCIFCLTTYFVQAQNTCATAVPISAGNHVVSVIDGTDVPSPICAANGNGATAGEWYSYTPSVNHNVTVTTDLSVNSGKDTRFHVYSGTCGALVCIGGDDDDGNTYGDYLSVDTFGALEGQTYYIAFDNKWSASGFTFQLTEAPYVEPPPVVIAFTPTSISMTATYRNCVVDMNGDYLDDIVGVSNSQVQILKQNAGGGFTSSLVTTPSANYEPSWSIAAGDIDKNGYNDLLYGSGQGVTFMKANDTGTGFTEMSGTEYVFSQRSNFIDINNDGHLDAFVCHDVEPNVYYTNDGNGNFSFTQGGLGDYPSGGNYGSIWIDYDNDGDSDLFIAKCRGGSSDAKVDELHRNNGDGTFTEVGDLTGMNSPSQSWSSAWGDFDNDGDMDALIGASSSSDGGHLLMRNDDGIFTNQTAGSGWDTFGGMTIEHVAHDFNNDGFVDVFGANNTIMINNGDFTFSPNVVAPNNGPIGDLNNDGFLDVQNDNTIYLNTANDNNWIKINLEGVESNGNGIGARVEIYGTFGKQIRDIRSGDGFRNMSSLNAHFGIGEATAITQVVVKWPSGNIDTVINPTINQSLLVTENQTLGVVDNSSLFFSLYPNPAKEVLNINFNSNETEISKAEVFDLNGRIVLKSKINNQSIDVHSLSSGTYIISLKDNEGKQYTQKFIKQ